jgi:hypothetical protein
MRWRGADSSYEDFAEDLLALPEAAKSTERRRKQAASEFARCRAGNFLLQFLSDWFENHRTSENPHI